MGGRSFTDTGQQLTVVVGIGDVVTGSIPYAFGFGGEMFMYAVQYASGHRPGEIVPYPACWVGQQVFGPPVSRPE